ncbi:MAG: nucleoside hydrolase [Sedimentisphaerales bacterium]|nr:nucleoside hydrolase [Sedimentisphaerales bacterium]
MSELRLSWIAVITVFFMALNPFALAGALSSSDEKIPIIFDTDICDDIDDTWALALLVQSPEFEVKLITVAVGNTPSKAKTVAKFLEIVGRTDIPVGIGVKQRDGAHRQDAWAKDYKLSSYPGTVYEDGVQALIDTIMNSREPIKVVAVGPLPNIAAALERETRIAEKAEFVGMHGSVRLGYGGNPKPSPEYNVKAYVKEAQKVFTAPWKMTITPLDTCGIVQLEGEKYQKVLRKNSPLTRALIANYHAWYRQGLINENKNFIGTELNRKINQKLQSSSTTLFDTVAVYLAMSTDLVRMEELGITVTDDGYTKIDDNAKVIHCATEWKDLGAFENFLVERLTK